MRSILAALEAEIAYLQIQLAESPRERLALTNQSYKHLQGRLSAKGVSKLAKEIEKTKKEMKPIGKGRAQ